MALTAEGTVRSASDGKLVLNLAGTNYELHLGTSATVVADDIVQGTITVKARKVWTIPAGGNLIQPLQGEPRVVQGKVKSVDGSTIVVQASAPIHVQLPAERTSFDLKNGQLAPGVMVNLTLMPGARFEKAV